MVVSMNTSKDSHSMGRPTTPRSFQEGNCPNTRLSGLSSCGPVPAPQDWVWEERRQSIECLYLVKNCTLSEVMRVMEQQHRFRATWVPTTPGPKDILRYNER